MPKATEHKTVQARLLAYAQEIGWRYVPRAEAEARRGNAQEPGLSRGSGLSSPGEATGWKTRSPLWSPQKHGLESPCSFVSFESKVKAFCSVPHVLRLLRDFIVFAEKPTVLLLIDRNELEDQMLKNLAAVGLGNVAHADSMAELVRLLRSDYRGIILTMIHKFRDMPVNVNRRNRWPGCAAPSRCQRTKRSHKPVSMSRRADISRFSSTGESVTQDIFPNKWTSYLNRLDTLTYDVTRQLNSLT